MKLFGKNFRKETLAEGTKQERSQVPTIEVERELEEQELIGLAMTNVNLKSPRFSWRKVPNTKGALYKMEGIKKSEDINLVLLRASFNTVCAESALILAYLAYRQIEEAVANGCEFADFSELLTYSFEEDGNFYTPSDIEKALKEYCMITKDYGKDVNKQNEIA